MVIMVKKLIIFVFFLLFITMVVFESNNNAYSTPFAYILRPLTKDKYQIGYTEGISFHLDNQTSNAVEMVTNVGGHNITKYFKYTSDQRTITVSNSSILANLNLMIPQQNNPTLINILRINGSFPV